MRVLKLSIVLFVLSIPAFAFAWGSMTHMFLGSEIFSLGSLLPAGIYAIIKKYRHDFLYGNLMADIIIGKKFLPKGKNPHSWDMALTLLSDAKTQQQKAFVYGYMSHLAADTIAHGEIMKERKNLNHMLVELRADSMIDRKYWHQAIRIDRKVQERNDIFLENSMERVHFSFKTNKRIFKSMLFLSCFNQEKVGEIIQRRAVRASIPTSRDIQQLHIESIDRIVDILSKGEASHVINANPMTVSSRKSIFPVRS